MISSTRFSQTIDLGRQAKLASTMARDQADVANGTRIQVPSDDPVASARISQLARAKADQATWIGNSNAAAAQAAQVDSSLGSVGSMIDRARELVLAGGNDTLNAQDRATLAAELKGIAADIRTASTERDSRGQSIFPEGEPLQIPISETVRVSATMSRAKVFGGVETATGPKDLATIMDEAAAALEKTDPAERQAATTMSIGDIADSVSHIAAASADQGVRAARIDAVKEHLTVTGTQQEEERSGLEDTDVAAALARISSAKLSLDAAQAVFARLNKSTLFDLLG